MLNVQRTSGIQTAFAVVFLMLATSQPVMAQDADNQAGPDDAAPAAPAPALTTPAAKPRGSDEPPPLNLGSPANRSKSEHSEESNGARWSGYASTARDALNAAISANSRTRDAHFSARFEIWVDSKG